MKLYKQIHLIYTLTDRNLSLVPMAVTIRFQLSLSGSETGLGT